MDQTLVIYLMVSIVAGAIIAGTIGEKKQLGFLWTLILCVITSPVIGGLIAYFSKDKEIVELEKKALLNQTKEDFVSKLKELSELRDKGVLTEEEFQRSKQRLINP